MNHINKFNMLKYEYDLMHKDDNSKLIYNIKGTNYCLRLYPIVDNSDSSNQLLRLTPYVNGKLREDFISQKKFKCFCETTKVVKIYDIDVEDYEEDVFLDTFFKGYECSSNKNFMTKYKCVVFESPTETLFDDYLHEVIFKNDFYNKVHIILNCFIHANNYEYGIDLKDLVIKKLGHTVKFVYDPLGFCFDVDFKIIIGPENSMDTKKEHGIQIIRDSKMGSFDYTTLENYKLIHDWACKKTSDDSKGVDDYLMARPYRSREYSHEIFKDKPYYLTCLDVYNDYKIGFNEIMDDGTSLFCKIYEH